MIDPLHFAGFAVLLHLLAFWRILEVLGGTMGQHLLHGAHHSESVLGVAHLISRIQGRQFQGSLKVVHALLSLDSALCLGRFNNSTPILREILDLLVDQGLVGQVSMASDVEYALGNALRTQRIFW